MQFLAMVLILLFFVPALCLDSASGRKCTENEIWLTIFIVKKHKHESDHPDYPRIFLKTLNEQQCINYFGNFKFPEKSFIKGSHNQYIRCDDLRYLKNIETINGSFDLELKHCPQFETLGTFMQNLRKINGSVEIKGTNFKSLNIRNFTPGAYKMTIIDNKNLCHLEDFRSLNPLIKNMKIEGNKDPKICRSEGKVCHKMCNPDKGCFGPEAYNCYDCRDLREEGKCVKKCGPGHYLPTTGKVCRRCHKDCQFGCSGPSVLQCYDYRRCPSHMLFDEIRRTCTECPRRCFGDDYQKKESLVVPVCVSWGNNARESAKCTVQCSGSLTITNGTLDCSPRTRKEVIPGRTSPSPRHRPSSHVRRISDSETENEPGSSWFPSGITWLFVLVFLIIPCAYVSFDVLKTRLALRNHRLGNSNNGIQNNNDNLQLTSPV